MISFSNSTSKIIIFWGITIINFNTSSANIQAMQENEDMLWLQKCSLIEEKKEKKQEKHNKNFKKDSLKPDEVQKIQKEQQQKIVYPENFNSWNVTADANNGKKLASICANCHALPNGDYASGASNMGPSLLHLTTIPINTDTVIFQKYIYDKIYNAKASNLCSVMPRFGEKKVFKPQEITDIMSYLFQIKKR